MLVRIAKIIADRGFCSRRQAEKYIEQGVVAADNEPVISPAQKFQEDAIIEVDGKILKPKPQARLWAYHKAVGVICSRTDPDNRPCLFDILPKNLPRLISVGRLDINSEGLILLTNNGMLARRFELPSNGFKRIYKVRARGSFNTSDIKMIESGVIINNIRYAPAKIKITGRSTNQSSQNNWYEIELMEGKNREVRNIFSHFGLQVNRLKRIQYGPYRLDGLKAGEIKELKIIC